MMELPDDSTILDLGCGNGSMLSRLRRQGWRLHGIEVSRSGLAEAQKDHPDIGFSYGDLGADLSSHHLAGKCDVVISIEVVEHIFYPRVFARNCHTFLKPGGMLVISTPYHGYLKNLVLAVTGKMDAHFTALWDCGHVKFWSRKTLTTLLEQAGFRVTAFYGVGRVPLLWKSMILVATRC
jgi:2-polyprenyl-3-methyl-5-hydroxy-6-metoxy-1,4-benzoquinol methylase